MLSENGELQIPPLRKSCERRVVGAGAPKLEHGEGAPLERRVVQGPEKRRRIDVARARRRAEDAVRREHCRACPMQGAVGREGTRHRFVARGKARGIAHDEIPGLAAGPRALEKAAYIGGDEGVFCRIDARSPEARLSRRVGRCGGVDAHDAGSSAQCRVQREAAGVREEIEDPSAAGKLADEPAIVALIEKRSRLLSPRDVDDERNAVLFDAHGLRRRVASKDF